MSLHVAEQHVILSEQATGKPFGRAGNCMVVRPHRSCFEIDPIFNDVGITLRARDSFTGTLNNLLPTGTGERLSPVRSHSNSESRGYVRLSFDRVSF